MPAGHYHRLCALWSFGQMVYFTSEICYFLVMSTLEYFINPVGQLGLDNNWRTLQYFEFVLLSWAILLCRHRKIYFFSVDQITQVTFWQAPSTKSLWQEYHHRIKYTLHTLTQSFAGLKVRSHLLLLSKFLPSKSHHFIKIHAIRNTAWGRNIFPTQISLWIVVTQICHGD